MVATTRDYDASVPLFDSNERIGMADVRSSTAVLVAGFVAALAWSGAAWAGGPGGVVEAEGDFSVAVGSGVINMELTGFTATGPTNEAASAAVIIACQQAGALDCSRDEVTNDNLCVVSVGAGDGSGIVAGGAGPTVDEARNDAFGHAEDASAPLDPGARIPASACP